MIKLTEVQKKLAEQLLITIKNHEMNVTYSELAERIRPPIHHRQIGKNIGQISLLCHELGLPLLSAKVVNKNTHVAGEGFYPLYEMMGIPTNGKTEQELYKAERQAIRDCKEWYKLEDYLGLDIGLPRPVPKQPQLSPKYLDARRAQPYTYSKDVLNTCFGVDYLKKHYDAWMKGAITFEADGVEYSVWFPKLAVNGRAASSSGWINVISDDGKLIEEYGSDNVFIPSEGPVLVFAKKGTEPYYFRGVFKADMSRSTEEHHYYNKIADVADFSSFPPKIHYLADEEKSDDHLVADLQNDIYFETADSFEYQGKPLPVPEPKQVNGRIVYPRNRQTAVNALAHAGYVCEIDAKHPTFIRKHSGKPYTEPHHLIPMAQQDRFPVSLDVEENIVSLCSNCHKHIHYGKGADELLKKLYEKRKEALRSVGIEVTEEELISFYG